jgi:hypothetical protein
MKKTRLTGVTLLAIVEFGFGMFRIGLVLVPLVRAFVARGVAPGGAFAAHSIAPGGMFLGLGLQALVILLGMFALIVGYGLWTGKSWSWSAALILSVVGIIETVVSIPFLTEISSHVIGILIALVSIYYLTRPQVRAFFRKEPQSKQKIMMKP